MNTEEFRFAENSYGFDVERADRLIGSFIRISGDWLFVPVFEFRYGSKTEAEINSQFGKWVARRESNPRPGD